MRTFLKVLYGFVATILILIVAAISWFLFYSRDLPDIGRLTQFAPATTTSVSDPCLGAAVLAIPYGSIGVNLRNALRAVEVREDDPGVLTTIYQGFTHAGRILRATKSVQVSRTLFCAPSKMLNRQLGEIRAAVQLERHFSQRELFTIYANRAYVGEGLIGVQSASLHFFHKNPGDLNVAEAALLAGLLQGPSYLSPVRHPDRALTRRNEVIDAMLQAGTITAPEAETARSAPLGITVNETRATVQ